MANVRKFLDLSTAHLDQSDSGYLDACAAPGSLRGGGRQDPIRLVRLRSRGTCRLQRAGSTPHLRRISACAREHGCEYVLFDADAEIDSALPVFDEKTSEEIDPQPALQD